MADAATTFSDLVRRELDEIHTMLVEKNRQYGNSALKPLRIFSKADPAEQIKVRIDDKLSRLKTQADGEWEDVVKDLIGYFVLFRIAQRGVE